VPDTEAIMRLLEPLYKDFRNNSEKLIASFPDKELKVLQAYFSKAIDIMNEATNKLNNK